MWEFFRLAKSGQVRAVQVPGYVFAAAIVLLSVANAPAVWLIAAAVLCILMVLSLAMLSSGKLMGYLASVSSTIFGVLYIALPLSLLVWVCGTPGGRWLALYGMVLVWTGDTMAFFIGRAWGRHKFSPHVSPKKTWEGAGASLLSAVGMGWVFVRLVWQQTSFLEAAVLAVVINVAAQIGDLAESALKRSAGVKDSSNLVPGHGGVLDRIDALLFAAPVLWYYWLWKSL